MFHLIFAAPDTKLFYVQLVFGAAFLWPLLMWAGLRALDKLVGTPFKIVVETWTSSDWAFYYAVRFAAASFITAMSILALAIVLAA